MNTKPEPANSISDAPGDIQLENTVRGQDRKNVAARIFEQSLKESELKYRELVENSPDAIAIYVDGKIVFANRECFSLMAASRTEDLIGKSVIQFVHPDYRGLVIERMKKTTIPGTVLPLTEEKFIRLDGSPVDVEVKAVSIVLDNKPAVQLIVRDLTERKRVEEELTKLRKAIERSGEIIFLTDRAGIFTYVNPGFTSAYGYTATEVVGKLTPRILKSGLMTSESYRLFWDTLLNGQEVKGELKNKTKDGTIIDIEGSSNAILDENKAIIGFLGIQRDITDRKREEEKLLFINKAVESTTDAIGISDAHGHHIYQNKALADLFEYPTAEELEAAGGGPAVVRDPVIAKEMFANIMSGKSWSGELEMVTKSGRVFPAYERANAIKDSKGNIIGLIGTINDITERKHVELIKQIQFNIGRQALLSESLNQFLETVCNELSRILDTTNFFVALYSQETDTLKQVYFKDQKDHFTEWKSKNSISGQVVLQAKTMLLKKPEVVELARTLNLNLLGTPAECWLGVPLIVDKHPIGVMVVQSYTDPAAFNQDSSDLLELIAHELSLYIGREKMIDDLMVAQKKAEESDRLKSAFLANMSHEIRTPMNGILGFAELLKEPDLSGEEQKQYISIIEKSGARMLNIINDIISISKVEAGQIEVSITETNVNKQLEFISDFFRPEVEQNGLKLVFKKRLPEKEAILVTDKEKVYAILTNLVKNAIKFTYQGYIEIGCEKKGKSIEFFVKDTGHGIQAEHQEFIFERFRQGTESLNRNYEGAGLGLSISKAYVEMLGGRIWVDSEAGKGSVFYFTIPVNG